jgi:hypothetical protein
MRPTHLTTKFVAGAMSVALSASVLAWPTPCRAGDDSVPIDTKIFRSILEGIGLRKDGEAINYQERSPLVIPPGNALPPPERSDAVVAKNPAWPVDPDVKRRQEEAALERDQNKLNADETLRHDQSVLRPDELTPGPKPRVTRRTDPDAIASSPGVGGNPLPPSELGTKKNIFSRLFGGSNDDEPTKFTGEPPRASLTAPPPGYQTPSPDQPYGIITKEKAKATNYTETHGLPDGAR